MPDSTSPSALGPFPEWDLSVFYAGPEDPAFSQDMAALKTEAKAFRSQFEGKLAGLSSGGFGKALQTYEALADRRGRLGSFAFLHRALDAEDPARGRFMQNAIEQLTEISTDLLFFTLEINRLEQADLDTKLQDPAAAPFRPWIELDVRAFKPHQLSDELEAWLLESSVVGERGWTRLFDETLASMRFQVEGTDEPLALEGVLNGLGSADPARRQASAEALSKGLGEKIQLFTQVMNTLVKSKALQDQKRGFARPVSSQNLANVVEDEVVDALTSAVVEAYPQLSHRYYRLKAKWFGVPKLKLWDRNAPLPSVEEKPIPWNQAEQRVLSAYGRFSPRLAELGGQFFGSGWIDAEPRPGKDSGAFAHPTVPSAHPFLLLNYFGKRRDVMTLAHELGHGVHQLLAAEQGALMADTPLTLAETASVFGEMLTFQSFLDDTTDPVARKALIAGKVEDMLNTVVRQVAFHQFETRVHDARAAGELSAEDLARIWNETQAEALGDAFEPWEGYSPFWAYVSHFIHVPFYVYAYAFGDCLVNSLYAVYREQPEGFADKYFALLTAGGTQRHSELLAPFGLDARDKGFWAKGLGEISKLIDALEALD